MDRHYSSRYLQLHARINGLCDQISIAAHNCALFLTDCLVLYTYVKREIALENEVAVNNDNEKKKVKSNERLSPPFQPFKCIFLFA